MIAPYHAIDWKLPSALQQIRSSMRRYGPFASDRHARDARTMSASPPIAHEQMSGKGAVAPEESEFRDYWRPRRVVLGTALAA